jgi:transketolase
VLARDGKQLAYADGLRRGAYVLSAGTSPQAVLVASGSEVQLALAAQVQLAEEGMDVQVVSMPSWELFEEQDANYRDSVLPPQLPKVSIEAGRTQGWSRWVDRSVGVERFGASAPGNEVLTQLGITTEAAVAAVRALV